MCMILFFLFFFPFFVDLSRIKTADPDWFFFSPVDLKYSNGSHVNRQTEAGFWKPTGQDREVKSGTNKIGTKKSLVFYKGRGRAAVRTNWVIHQYRADIAGLPANVCYIHHLHYPSLILCFFSDQHCLVDQK